MTSESISSISTPGFLAVGRGEILWYEKRGSENDSLEECDLKLGAGKPDGASQGGPLLRRFEQSHGSRAASAVVHAEHPDLDTKAVAARRFSEPGKPSDMEYLVAFIANKSNGIKIDVE